MGPEVFTARSNLLMQVSGTGLLTPPTKESMLFGVNLPLRTKRHPALAVGFASFLAVLLAWNLLAIGFHKHVERNNTRVCEVCAATQIQATGEEVPTAPTAPLRPLEVVALAPDESPRVFAHLFVPNRAPPLA